jgi:hypothetical protein
MDIAFTVCVCVCMCVCACVRACACVCVCVLLVPRHARTYRHSAVRQDRLASQGGGNATCLSTAEISLIYETSSLGVFC